MLGDLRDALRQLKKAPGFTTTALITLALGIGATTAIFTLVHQVMLKSLPVAKPGELWRIGDKDRCCNWGGYTQGDDGDFALFSWEAYKHFRAHTPEFSDLAALQAGNAALGVRRAGSQSPADTRNGEYVSGNFFRTFGVQPWIGRLLTDEDDVEGAPPVAVMVAWPGVQRMLDWVLPSLRRVLRKATIERASPSAKLCATKLYCPPTPLTT